MNKKKSAANTKVKIQHGGGARVEGAEALLNARREPGTRMSVLLANPDYLLEGFAEKRCQYIGVIDDIPTSADMSNRNYLLAKLDDRRNSGKLPWRLSLENNVSITLSAYNVKIIKDDRAGNILHRIPIHEIAAVSYVNDDDQHLVFLKAGDASKQQCPCHVLLCPKRADAEEICTILQQAFQLVFTEATMEHLNNSISAGARESAFLPAPVPQSQPPHADQSRGSRPQKWKQSQATAMVVPVPEGSSDSEDHSAVIAGDPHSNGEGHTAEELVQQYMARLHKLLGFKELHDFATLLKSYRDNMPVLEFLTKLKALYGAQRAFLIPDMRSFIPEEDRAVFEKFLQDHNLERKKQTTSSSPQPHHSPCTPVPPTAVPPPPPSMTVLPTSIPPPPTTAPPPPPPTVPLPPTASPPLPLKGQSPQGDGSREKHRKDRQLRTMMSATSCMKLRPTWTQ